MPIERAVDRDEPVYKAWNIYKETDDFKNSLKWTMDKSLQGMAHEQTCTGSLWAAFVAGYNMRVKP